jgi:thiamine biosynthesis lipoprotein
MPNETVAAARPVEQVLQHREEVMGTIVSIDVYAYTDVVGPDLASPLARACRLLHDADEVFSTWKPQSPMSRLRRGEIGVGEVTPQIDEVLELCAIARGITRGWFDPWAMPGGVDPTGYVKGWAAERALAELTGEGICGAMVNAAGDIACSGGPEPAQPWRIGIVDPHSTDRLACVVEVVGAIATSGIYERGMHLIDPRTRLPAAQVVSASVTGPDLGLADALATALMVAGEGGLELVENLEGYEGMTIGFDGAINSSRQFPIVVARHTRGTPDQPVACRSSTWAASRTIGESRS